MIPKLAESESRALDLVSQIIQVIKVIFSNKKTALHEPSFFGNEWLYMKDCLDSTYVSSIGKYVDIFEDNLANITGTKHAIAVVNGTAALHIALLLAGVQQGDEVLVPTLTFVATANAVSYCGATPHFVDSCEKTLGIDALALREWLKFISEKKNGVCFNKNTGRPIRALVPMHVFGHPCDLNELYTIAMDFNLELIEDAAEALGSFYYGRHVGSFGKLGTLSFNGNKIVTTGGGGAIITNNSELARKAKHLTTTAKINHQWSYVHDEIGFNYRLPNLNAALGCAQLEQLQNFLQSKRKLFYFYKSAFNDIRGVRLLEEQPECQSNYWLQALILDESNSFLRDQILSFSHNMGVMTRPAWTLMHYLNIYQKCPRAPLSIAESLERRLINLPSSAGLV